MDKKEIPSAHIDNLSDGIAFNETVVQIGSVDAQSVLGLKSITGITDWENADHVRVATNL